MATVYTVTANDGCSASPAHDSTTVRINPVPKVDFVSDVKAGCSPICVQFKDSGTFSSQGIKSWLWNFGDTTSSSSQTPTHCYNYSGTYPVSLTITSDSGCSATKTIPNMITVYSHPKAQFAYSPQQINMLDPTVQFVDQSTDAYGITSWSWNFGDERNSTSTMQNPSHTYSDTLKYCIDLIVTNTHGCTDSVQNCLDVLPMFTIYIPNAFSPNGDGLNDVFTAKGVGIATFQMFIFDRWGMQLYQTENIHQGWNGTVNGGSNIVQEDTYVYEIFVTDIFNQKHSFIGKVTVVD